MLLLDKPLPRYPLCSVADYRKAALQKVPKQLFAFLDGGAFDEVSYTRNKGDFQDISLRRKVMQPVSQIDTSITILGQKLSAPLALSPVAYAGLYAGRGEVQAAKAAAQADIPFSLSTMSICSIDEVASNTTKPFWFQYYQYEDRGLRLELLQRAQAARCPVLLFTVDLPKAGIRYRYDRSRRCSRYANFIDTIRHLPWWYDVYIKGKPHTLGNLPRDVQTHNDIAAMRQWMAGKLSKSYSWKDLEWLRAHWHGKIVIKGILDADDAVHCLEHGADGIVVSNHGGRHLDSTPSTIAALPSISAALQGRLPILLDGGVSSGLDIVKAIALGANACMIGRPWVYGLAACGEQGVSDVISIYVKELQIAMTHLGVSSIYAITPELLC